MSVPDRLWTEAEYLATEDASPLKREFVNGRVYAMAGASPNHNRITFNLAGALYPQLARGSCHGFSSDMRVGVAATKAYFYPDLSALCGPPEFADPQPMTLLNPTVLLEVLSTSTEGFDRGDKFEHYRRIPTLREYVLVAQDRVFVERRVRAGDGWTLTAFERPGDVVELPSVDARFRLSDAYRDLAFPLGAAPMAPKLVREESPAAYA